ncbi:hypothetical protein A0U87_07475 [Sphingobium sp. MP9-4]|nr:hypothetical protein A0U87_07475 [Sphingobium sp. MP9-4]
MGNVFYQVAQSIAFVGDDLPSFFLEKGNAFGLQLMRDPDAGGIGKDRLSQILARSCLEIIVSDVDLDA